MLRKLASYQPNDPTRYRRGEDNPAARLTEAQVREIKWLQARGAGDRFLAQRYGVSAWTIGEIRRGKRWRHVPDPSLRYVERQGEERA